MWDFELIRREAETPGTAVFVSRRGRLLQRRQETPQVAPFVSRRGRRLQRQEDEYQRVNLTWVDEAALSLVAQALRSKSSIALLYPVPAGELAALVAAQALVHLFLGGRLNARVGVVTADPARIRRAWSRMAVVELDQVIPVEQWFRCLRARADGSPPPIGPTERGLLVGNRKRDWPVDVTVFDHLNGALETDSSGELEIHLFSDPLEAALDRWVSSGRPLWGWPHSLLRAYGPSEPHDTGDAPFSVANDRVRVIQDGSELVVRPVLHERTERLLTALLDDLRVLGEAAAPFQSMHVTAGLRRAWAHAYTLMSLPCRPSEYDWFCGRPPRAALATSAFADEIAAWARTLPGEMVEYALTLAEDIQDLRDSLERDDVVLPVIRESVADGDPPLIVVRTRTSAKALCAALDIPLDHADPDLPLVRWYRSLHTVESRRRALVIGPPPRAVWHMVDGGLASETVVLVLGTGVAQWAAKTVTDLRKRREAFGGQGMRERTWRILFSAIPPPPPETIPPEPPVEVEGILVRPSPEDPFAPLRKLLLDDRPLLEEDGFESVAVRDESGRWSGVVDAVEVHTDEGILLLAEDASVEVLDDDAQITACEVRDLCPGMQILIPRGDARRLLLDSIAEHIEEERSDLRVARMVVESFQERIQRGFATLRRTLGDMAVSELCRRVRAAGSVKTDAAIRSWIDPAGPMGPRDTEDLQHLCQALCIPIDEQESEEVRAALARIRGFRRALGRALSAAARRSVAADDSQVDPDTGLSVADLRELVTVATVVDVIPAARRVRATAVGMLVTGVS